MSERSIVSYVVGLGIVGLALAAFYWIARAWKFGRLGLPLKKRLISVIETAPLTQHVFVHVVRIGARYYVLAAADANVRIVCELPAADVELAGGGT